MAKSVNPWRSEKVRLTQEQVRPLAVALRLEMHRLNPDLEFHFGGSYRRGAQTVGDLDTVCVVESLTEVIFPESVTIHRGGVLTAQGDFTHDGRTVHVDFWSAKPEARGAFLWFITGPKELNIAMRVAAMQQGLMLSQTGLFDSAHRQVDDGTEAGVARLLGSRWESLLNPLTRELWNEPGAPSIRVKSETSDAIYLLRQYPDHTTCSCKGFTYRGDCKHVRALTKDAKIQTISEVV